jgi:hypothetical protein
MGFDRATGLFNSPMMGESMRISGDDMVCGAGHPARKKKGGDHDRRQ